MAAKKVAINAPQANKNFLSVPVFVIAIGFDLRLRGTRLGRFTDRLLVKMSLGLRRRGRTVRWPLLIIFVRGDLDGCFGFLLFPIAWPSEYQLPNGHNETMHQTNAGIYWPRVALVRVDFAH